ncbi:MAG: hypothetical protein U0166_20855 [Acidobacteriota bacterium]
MVVQTRRARIVPLDLPQSVRAPQEPRPGFQDATLEFQRNLIRNAMTESGGNATRAAEILALKHATHLYQICKRLGLRTDALRDQVLPAARAR